MPEPCRGLTRSCQGAETYLALRVVTHHWHTCMVQASLEAAACLLEDLQQRLQMQEQQEAALKVYILILHPPQSTSGAQRCSGQSNTARRACRVR